MKTFLSPMLQRIEIRGEFVTVELFQRTRHSWAAVGEFKGQTVTARDGSKETALRRWHDAAERIAVHD